VSPSGGLGADGVMIVGVTRQVDRASRPTRFVRDINIVAAHLSSISEQDTFKGRVVAWFAFGFWLDRLMGTRAKFVDSFRGGACSLSPFLIKVSTNLTKIDKFQIC